VSWLQQNVDQLFPEGGVVVQGEVRSTCSGLHKRADAVLYMDNWAACKRYVLLELDDREHRRIGLVEDMFRVNWFINARFPGAKVYVVRLNPDEYELSDGQRVHGPPLEQRLARLAAVLRHLYTLRNPPGGYVRLIYLYYSPDRLKCLLHRAGCRLITVEKDVEYTLVYRPHEDPGYLAARQTL
jgi:hypothetical protein